VEWSGREEKHGTNCSEKGKSPKEQYKIKYTYYRKLVKVLKVLKVFVLLAQPPYL